MSNYKIYTTLVNTGVTPLGYKSPKSTFSFELKMSSTTDYSSETHNINVANIVDPPIPTLQRTFESVSDGLGSTIALKVIPEVVNQICILRFRFTYPVGTETRVIVKNILVDAFHYNLELITPEYIIDVPMLDNDLNTYNITLDISVKSLENFNTPSDISFIFHPTQNQDESNESIVRDYFTDETLGNFISGSYYTNFISSSVDNYRVIAPQVSVSYGHKEGSGSLNVQSDNNDTPTRLIYNQIKNVFMNQYDSSSIYINGIELDQTYNILLGRNNKGSHIGINHIEINLQELLGTGKVNTSGSSLTIIGDPDDIQYNGDKAYSPLVSGSIADGVFSSATYGYVLYDQAVIMLTYTELDSVLNFNTENGSDVDGNNAEKLFESLSGSIGISALGNYRRNEPEYVCYSTGNDFNYSNNPSSRKTTGTFISSSTDTREKFGRFRFETVPQDSYSAIEEPFSYITSVGLYDSGYNLLAVAKLSQAIKKDQHKALSIGVRIKND